MTNIDRLIDEAIRKNVRQRNKKDTVELVNDPKCFPKKEGDPYNRPVKINGRIFYVSRSSVVSMKCFCRNRNGEWCILANKRGKGTTNAGAWNTPVGYLDYGETLEEAAARETYEETGVKIPLEKIEYLGMESSPRGGKQDVVIRFKAILDGVIDQYTTSNANAEPDEVEDIQWIPLSMVNDKQYKWNGDAQMYHAKQALGNDLSGRSKGEIITDLVGKLKNEINGNPRAEALLDEILKNL